MSFPLGDWIINHPGMPHDLSISGVDNYLSLQRVLRREGPATYQEIASIFARYHGVAPERIYLSHGATLSNAAVLLYLARDVKKRRGRAPRVQVDLPEYPPLLDTAKIAGFSEARGRTPDIRVLSDPHNPTGRAKSNSRLAAMAEKVYALHIDETFREFTDAKSLSHKDWPNLWLTRSFTKVYGTGIQVGYAVVPEKHVKSFNDFTATILDSVSSYTLGLTKALWQRRREVLGESRRTFQRNVTYLNRAFPAVRKLEAPVWFDRGACGLPGDRVARVALRSGVLVCPGSFFGDSTGIRICLTKKSFPEDLEAYLRVRERFLH